ncbi:MAG TPA: chemotaxis protein CheC, partial [Petrotogaceae bacterium]|nr:chemotaxis protein CheC [Petrotogaceae bacterium]
MLGDEFLTQDELNSLLNGLNSDEVKQPDNNPLLDMMGEIGNIAMGAGSTTMSTLLRKKVSITSPDASIIKFKDIKTKFSGQQLVITINYKKGLEGLNTFVMPARIAQIIADLMMGGNGDLPAEVQLDELGMSAAGEAMNQMMGSAATAMAEFIKTPVDITPPTVSILDFDNGDTKFPPIESNDEAEIICIKFSMEIKEIATTTVWQFIPMHFAKHIESLMKGPETPAF